MSDDLEPRRVSVLPPTRSLLEAGLDLAFAKLLERIEPPFPALMDPHATPAEFLPYLAADRGVSEWKSTASVATKRATVASIWAIRRLGGTRKALALAAEAMGFDPEIVAWHRNDPAGSPYGIRVIARARGAYDEAVLRSLEMRLQEAKAERDDLALDIVSTARGRLYAAAALVDGQETTVYPYIATDLEITGLQYFAAACQDVIAVTIYPEGQIVEDLVARRTESGFVRLTSSGSARIVE